MAQTARVQVHIEGDVTPKKKDPMVLLNVEGDPLKLREGDSVEITVKDTINGVVRFSRAIKVTVERIIR